MSELIRRWMKLISPEQRQAWAFIASEVQVKEFTRDGKRHIRLTHTPTGIVVTKIRGASVQESYVAALSELIDAIESSDASKSKRRT